MTTNNQLSVATYEYDGQIKAVQLFPQLDASWINSDSYIKALMDLDRRGPETAYAAHVSRCMPWIVTDAFPTAATDGFRGYINRDFWDSLPAEQRPTLIFHEAGHVEMRHPQRAKAYLDRGYVQDRGNVKIPLLPYWWNYYGDQIINARAWACGLPAIDRWVFDRSVKPTDMLEDLYLAHFPDDWEPASEKDDPTTAPHYPTNPSPEGDEDSDGTGGPSGFPSPDSGDTGDDGEADGDDDGDDDGDAGDSSQQDENSDAGGGSDSDADADADDDADAQGTGQPDPLKDSTQAGHDVHLMPEYEGTPDQIEDQKEHDRRQQDLQRDIIMRDVEATAKAGGFDDNSPATGGSMVDESRYVYDLENRPRIAWRDELRKYMQKRSRKGKPTMGRIHRRKYMNLGVIAPTFKGTFERAALVMDTSYSVQRFGDRVDQFMHLMADLIDEMRPTRGTQFVQCGDRVRSAHEVRSGNELLDVQMDLGGGTYMSSALEWIDQNDSIKPDVTIVFSDGEFNHDDIDRMEQRKDLIIVLVKQPHSWYMRNLDDSRLRYIIADDEAIRV